MISPYLYDIWPFLLLIFSPLETVDFLMLLRLPGDGFSLLCSKKPPPRHTCSLSKWRLIPSHGGGGGGGGANLEGGEKNFYI
jgi:hypothetical protein